MRVLIRIADPSLAGQVRGLTMLAGIPECSAEELLPGDLCLLGETGPAADLPADVRRIVLAEEPLPRESDPGATFCALPLSYRALWELLRGTGEDRPPEGSAKEAKRSEPVPAAASAEGKNESPADPPTASSLTRTVRRGSRTAVLTAREFAVFATLVRHAGAAVSRETLSAQAWADASPKPASNAADVTVGYVRRKLAPLFGEGAILTKRGKGYVWCGGEVRIGE